jgi:exodeoxyribonuclease VII small subunit
MAKKKSESDAKPAPSFEQAMGGLEQAVSNLEEGELELGEALQIYEQAVKMVRRCHTLLKDAERQVELLMEIREDGTVVTESFDETEDQTLTEKQETRSQRRSAPTQKKPVDANDPNRLF